MRFYFFICFLVISNYSFSQKKQNIISATFENDNLKSVIIKLEEKSDYSFYYIEEWLKSNKKFTKTYKNVLLVDILKDIVKDLPLNFYFLDNRIILTKNNYIKDGSIFTSSSNIYSEDNYLDDSNVIRIGKADKNSTKKSFKLKGYVKDNQNSPLSGILVSVKGKSVNAETNINGYYEINLEPGFNVLRFISSSGNNEEKKIMMFNSGNFNLTMLDNLITLDEVVIKANKDNNIKKAITGLTSLNLKKIKNVPTLLGVNDILKVATTLPGISTAGEGSSGFNVRGGKSDQNLILLDNAVIYNPSHFFGIFSGINPSASGSVNIYKGSIPSEYGGRLSSVFDINTKTGNMEKTSANISLGPVMTNISLEQPIIKNKSSLLLGGRITHSNWILKSLKNESLNKSEASFFDIITNYTHNLNDNHKLKISGYYSKDKFRITSDSLYNYSNSLVSINWKHKINKNNKGTFSFSNSQYQFGINYDSNANIVNKNFDLEYKINDSELKYKVENKSFKKHNILYGISGKLYNVSPGSITPLNDSKIIPVDLQNERAGLLALFASDQYDINERLLINFGVRATLYSFLGENQQRIYAENLPINSSTLLETKDFKNNEIIKTYFGPEFNISSRYFLKDNISIKASYNNSYQFIHTLSNNTTPSPTDTWKLSDSNIKPQESNQFALGLHVNSKDNVYEFSLEGYYKQFKNTLDYKTGAELLLNETVETEVLQGIGKAYGIELLIKKTSGKINGWLGYSYSRSFNKFDSQFNEEVINSGDYFPSNFDRPHDISLITNFKFTKRFSMSTSFFYQTGRPITYPVGNYLYNGAEFVLYSDRNKFRIPDYYRLDLSLNFEGNHKKNKIAHSFWNISVYNILGRNNPYSFFFQTIDGNVKAFKTSIFSKPIPTISYNIKF